MHDCFMVLVFYDSLRVISAYLLLMLAISLVLEGNQMSAEIISKIRAEKLYVVLS